MLLGILVHVMFFHFILGFLFDAMHAGIPNSAGHGYGVASVRRQPNGLAVKLPGAAIFGRQLVLVSALGLRQTAGQGANLRALVSCETNRRNHQQRGYGNHTQQQFILHEVLLFDSAERICIRSAVFADCFIVLEHKLSRQHLTRRWNSSPEARKFHGWDAKRRTYAVLVLPRTKCKTRSTRPTTSRM